MKQLFKISCLLFITVGSIYSQEVEIINKTFEVNEKTIVELDLKNINFNIEPSPDDKIYLNLSTVLYNYKNKDIEKYKERVKVNAKALHNTIKITGHGSYWSDIHKFYLTSDLIPELGKKIEKDTSNIKKSKKEILEEINLDVYGNVEGKNLEKKPILNKKKYKKIRISKEQFILKIPSHVKLRIKGENANFLFKEHKNPTELNIERGGLLAKSMINPKNKVYVKDAYFKVGMVEGGKYRLNDLPKGLVGEIKNTDITSNFSKLEIGEIDENVSVTDFNGKLWFYDFSSDFKKFNLKSEYSKIHLFYPKTDFNLTAMGNNAINMKIHYPNKKIVGGTSTADSFYKMITHKVKGIGHFSGDIHLEIDNGIIEVYKNDFDSNKN